MQAEDAELWKFLEHGGATLPPLYLRQLTAIYPIVVETEDETNIKLNLAVLEMQKSVKKVKRPSWSSKFCAGLYAIDSGGN
jgi:hypothetical protein